MSNHIRVASLLAHLLDSRFKILGRRFGFAFLFEIIPGFGDIVAALLSLYIVWIGIQMHLPKEKIIKMILNIAINFFIGLLPVLGDAIYLFRHANLMNVEILKQYAKKSVMEGEVVA